MPDETDTLTETAEREPVARTVGISLDLWYFPEFDQWKFAFDRNPSGEPRLAIGPLRLMWRPFRIWR